MRLACGAVLGARQRRPVLPQRRGADPGVVA